MPLVQIQTSHDVKDEKKPVLLESVSALITEVTGKPGAYVMVTLNQADIHMAGTLEPGAYVNVRSIGGLTGEVNVQLTEGICSILQKELGISSDRVYITYADVLAQNWGWNNTTFG